MPPHFEELAVRFNFSGREAGCSSGKFPGHTARDGPGAVPLFSCPNGRRLGADLTDLAGRFVSVVS